MRRVELSEGVNSVDAAGAAGCLLCLEAGDATLSARVTPDVGARPFFHLNCQPGRSEREPIPPGRWSVEVSGPGSAWLEVR
jgi:hypothetical protein